MHSRGHQVLLIGMLIGLLAGGLTGWALGERADYYFAFLGQFFLTALRMLVLPLIVCSLISAVGLLGDVRRLGKTAVITLLYYLTTTALAVLLGIVLVNLIQPGRFLRGEGSRSGIEQTDAAIQDLRQKIAEIGTPKDPASRRQMENLRWRLSVEEAKRAKVEQFRARTGGLFQAYSGGFAALRHA